MILVMALIFPIGPVRTKVVMVKTQTLRTYPEILLNVRWGGKPIRI